MNQINDNEIDLFDLFITIWDGKWKIIAFVIISILGVIVFQFTQTKPYKIITNIKPITSAEAEKYLEINEIGKALTNLEIFNKDLFKITPDLLLDMYSEILDERVLFEDAFREVELLDIKKYEDKEQYEKAIISLASKIKIFNPGTIDNKRQSSMFEYITIEFITDNSEKWKMALSIADNNATQLVKKNLKLRFRSFINTKKKVMDYKTEDIETKIANLMNDYDTITASKLAYLKEQSSIAHKLGVAMNAVDSQTYDTQRGFLTNIAIEKPYYLRGYKSIDEEIKLMLSRVDKKLFIDGLIGLENELRSLNQDQTLYRAENTFASTPIGSANQRFFASRISIESSTISANHNNITNLFLTVVIAGMIGVMYVLISNSLRKRNKKIA